MRWSIVLAGALVASPVGAADVAWKPPLNIATGAGVRGPWQQNDSRYDYVDDPSVAVAEGGAVALVWVDQGRKDVYFRRLDSDQVLNVSRSPATFSWLPRVAFAPGDARRVFILWQEIIFSGGSHGGDILFARSEDGGATFSTPLNLSSSVGGDGKGRINPEVWHNGSLDLAVGSDGTLYTAWTEYDGPLWVAASHDGGKSFLPRIRIEDKKPARGPSLAVAPDGTAYLAWTVGEDAGADIRVARSTNRGASFHAPRLVEPNNTYSDAPKIAVDRSGGVHLAWAESTGGPFARYRVRYTRSENGAQSFARSQVVSGANGAFPQLALDANGGVYVAWELFNDARHRPRGLGFAVSRDAGRSFSAPAAVPQSAAAPGYWNGSFQGLLMKKLAVNGEGTIALVNSSLKDNEASRVWLLRGQGAY